MYWVNIGVLSQVLSLINDVDLEKEAWYNELSVGEKATIITRWHNLLVREIAHAEISKIRGFYTERAARSLIGGSNEVFVHRAIAHDVMPRNCGTVKAFAEIIETLPFDSHDELYALCQRLILDETMDRQKIMTKAGTVAVMVVANNQKITKPDDYTITRARKALDSIADIRQYASDYLSAHADLDPGEHFIETKHHT